MLAHFYPPTPCRAGTALVRNDAAPISIAAESLTVGGHRILVDHMRAALPVELLNVPIFCDLQFPEMYY